MSGRRPNLDKSRGMPRRRTRPTTATGCACGVGTRSRTALRTRHHRSRQRNGKRRSARVLAWSSLALLVLVVLEAFGPMPAFASAPSPVVGSSQGELVANPNGSVTVYVRGEWNWLSHNRDCNEDRAGAGVGLVWNDPTEPGYPIREDGVSASVGVASLRAGDTSNLIDGMVHPVDLGNVPQGFTAPPGFPTGQVFENPAPQAAGQPHPFAEWAGGCGREPLAGAGAGQFEGRPWGSWGYDVSSIGSDGKVHLGYAHTYARLSEVSTVCVSFYDVHGGGKPGTARFQVPDGSKEIDVLRNRDNSIATTKFDANGASCLTPKAPAEPNFTIEVKQSLGNDFTTSELFGHLDEVIHYEVLVTNTGNVPLKLTGFSDPRCTNITAGASEIGVGVTTRFTCEHTLTSFESYVNEATIIGNEISKTSNRVVTAVAGQQIVEAACTINEAGYALTGVSGVKRAPFTARLRALGIRQVTFFLDGHKLKLLSVSQARGGLFSVRIDPRKYHFGAHKVSVKAVLEEALCGAVARTAVFVRPRPYHAVSPHGTAPVGTNARAR